MRVGVVVIGRNESRGLARSLRSVLENRPALVYADSGSTDGSPDIAEGLGAAVVRLGGTPPLSAANGRNAGRALLGDRFPALEYIQFVDGDTEIEPGWIERATAFLDEHPDVAAVAGRLRERLRERNVYHRLADMEFDVEPGNVDAIGGIGMYRATAFDATGGFDPNLISGEERELCSRITRIGMQVVQLADDMATHDIDMNQFGQWWRRTKRCGQTAAAHFADRGLMGRSVASMLAWGAVLPGFALALALPTFGSSFLCLSAYPVLWERVRRSRLQRGATPRDARLYASATVLGKVPEAMGVLEFAVRRAKASRA